MYIYSIKTRSGDDFFLTHSFLFSKEEFLNHMKDAYHRAIDDHPHRIEFITGVKKIPVPPLLLVGYMCKKFHYTPMNSSVIATIETEEIFDEHFHRFFENSLYNQTKVDSDVSYFEVKSFFDIHPAENPDQIFVGLNELFEAHSKNETTEAFNDFHYLFE
jgi:hypothetical protein